MAESKLKIDIRRNTILEKLRRDKKVYVAELSEALKVTPVTIRNDLNSLEKDGYLVRMNGGAVYSNRNIEKMDRTDTAQVPCIKEKESIAKAIASMIKNGDTIFINSGTTTQLVASELRTLDNLNIVTNSLSVAMSLGNIASFRVILLGGEINTKYGFTYGADAQEKLNLYHADWAILSVDGIGAENGITTYHAEEALLDRIMINSAARTIVAADSTKIGRTGFLRVCECADNITLVTNKNDSQDEMNALAERGVEILEA